MATSAKTAMGSVLAIGDGAPTEVFTTVPEVTSIKESGVKVDQVEVTHMGSLGKKEFIYGNEDTGTLAVVMNYLPTNTVQQGLFTAKDAKTVKNFKITLPATLGVITFSGVIETLERDLDPAKQMILNMSLKLSGATTYAPS